METVQEMCFYMTISWGVGSQVHLTLDNPVLGPTFQTWSCEVWSLLYQVSLLLSLVWASLYIFLFLLPGMEVFTPWHCTLRMGNLYRLYLNLKRGFDSLSSIRLWILFSFDYIHSYYEMIMSLWYPSGGMLYFE